MDGRCPVRKCGCCFYVCSLQVVTYWSWLF
jgi:hypothetical protein